MPTSRRARASADPTWSPLCSHHSSRCVTAPGGSGESARYSGSPDSRRRRPESACDDAWMSSLVRRLTSYAREMAARRSDVAGKDVVSTVTSRSVASASGVSERSSVSRKPAASRLILRPRTSSSAGAGTRASHRVQRRWLRDDRGGVARYRPARGERCPTAGRCRQYVQRVLPGSGPVLAAAVEQPRPASLCHDWLNRSKLPTDTSHQPGRSIM